VSPGARDAGAERDLLFDVVECGFPVEFSGRSWALAAACQSGNGGKSGKGGKSQSRHAVR
jgi:hypothetical protein